MARIFNIYFEYNGLVYNAVVSVRSTPFFTEYILNNITDELLESLPGNKIIAKGGNELKFPNATAENSTQLMDAIIRAVSEHLHTTKV
jgi:hypothetical protein